MNLLIYVCHAVGRFGIHQGVYLDHFVTLVNIRALPERDKGEGKASRNHHRCDAQPLLKMVSVLLLATNEL